MNISRKCLVIFSFDACSIGFQIRNVWSLNIKDRWRLYRRWLKDVSESYGHTISLYQEQFEAGAKKMKDIRNLEDFEVLKNADVVGMTTTGKLF